MGWVRLSGFIKDPLESEAHKGLQLHGPVSPFPKYFVSRDCYWAGGAPGSVNSLPRAERQSSEPNSSAETSAT